MICASLPLRRALRVYPLSGKATWTRPKGREHIRFVCASRTAQQRRNGAERSRLNGLLSVFNSSLIIRM